MNLQMISQCRREEVRFGVNVEGVDEVTSARLTEGFVYTLNNNLRVQKQRCHGLYSSL